MTFIAITGTPGTGKTSTTKELENRGYKVLYLNDYIRSKGLLEERDEERDTFNVDIDAVNLSIEEFREEPLLLIEGHIAHCLDCDIIVVIRSEPETLAQRLRERGYSESKVTENVQAEILDVILCEATETDIQVCELASSDDSISVLADKIEDIIKGNIAKYPPGNNDWTGELDRWF